MSIDNTIKKTILVLSLILVTTSNFTISAVEQPLSLLSGLNYSVMANTSDYNIMDIEKQEYTVKHSKPIHNNKNTKLIEKVGDILQIALPLTALFVAYDDEKPLSDFLTPYLVTELIMLTTKYVVNETRPNGAPYSFPSGHTTSAYSGATYLALSRPSTTLVAQSLALFTGFSRVYANKHWVHDVVAGAFLGSYIQLYYNSK